MLKLLLRSIFKTLFRVRVTGEEHIPRNDKLLIIANHESFLDGLILALFLPIEPVFVVHTTVLRHRFFRLLLSQARYLAVDPMHPMAMKQVVKLLEQGQTVMIFPEGRITQTGGLMKVYDGPAFVAAKTRATILPIRLDGPARSFFSRMSGKIPRMLFPRITVSIHPPTRIELAEGQSAKQRRRAAGEAMRKIMQNMLFASRPEQTLFSAFITAVQTYGRKTKLVEDIRGVELSYAELKKITLALGRLMTGLSKQDEAVGVLLPNLATTFCLILGMGAMRRVPAMLNYTAGTDGIQNACAVAKIETVITSRKFLETAKLEETVAELKNLNIIYLEDLQKRLTLLDKLWLIGFALWFPRLAVEKVSPDAPAVILFTSGSEGKPKGVILSHRAILANVAQIKAVIDFTIEDKFMNVLPIFHAFGLSCGTIMPILTGTKLFLYPSPLHYKVIPEVIYDRGCTVLFGTSTFLANYAKYAHSYDFYKLRYVVAGAEKLKSEVRDVWMEKFGIRILEGYGATECAPVLAVNTPMACKAGTVGTLLPGIEHQIIAVPGIEQGGVLHVRGPNLMSGYYLHDKPAQLQPCNSACGMGWYNTGDVVDIDQDGFVTIKGRVKRFAKIAGEMVSLETTEQIACMASPEHAHAATSIPDEQRGEAIVLFTTDSELARDVLVDIAKKNGLPEFAVARKVIPVAEIPLLGTGKTDYVALKKLAESL